MKKVILFLVAILAFLLPVSSLAAPEFRQCEILYGDKSYNFNSEIRIKEEGGTITIKGFVLDFCSKAGTGNLEIRWTNRESWESIMTWTCDRFGIPRVEKFPDNVSYTYANTGTYYAQIRARDAGGSEAFGNWTVIVGSGEGGDEGGDSGGGTVGDITIGPLNLPNPFCDKDDEDCEVKSFGDLINKIIEFVFTLAIILAPILLIIAGIMFLFAGGDPAKVQKAKKLILYTVIGFTIIALARLFVELIQQVFGVKE